jgi:hypothetical protein
METRRDTSAVADRSQAQIAKAHQNTTCARRGTPGLPMTETGTSDATDQNSLDR